MLYRTILYILDILWKSIKSKFYLMVFAKVQMIPFKEVNSDGCPKIY